MDGSNCSLVNETNCKDQWEVTEAQSHPVLVDNTLNLGEFLSTTDAFCANSSTFYLRISPETICKFTPMLYYSKKISNSMQYPFEL